MPKSFHRRTFSNLLTLALAVGLQGCGDGNPPPVTFSLQDLGTLGGADSVACDINASGQAVGYSFIKGNSIIHSFMWDGKALVDLGIVAGSPGCTFGINDAGQVAGSAKFGEDRYPHPALLALPTPTDLGGVGYGQAINASGQIAGNVFPSGSGITHATTWKDLKMTDLGTLGGKTSNATDINDKGWIAGFSDATGDAETKAVIWKDNVPTELKHMGGKYSFAMGINDAGQVVGYSSPAWDSVNSASHAALWYGTKPIDLGTLGGDNSMAFGINDKGLVVGSSQVKSGGPFHATLWIDHKAYDLNAGLDASGSGWTLSEVRNINAKGQIVGWGKSPSGTSHGFILTPTKPIPVSGTNG